MGEIHVEAEVIELRAAVVTRDDEELGQLDLDVVLLFLNPLGCSAASGEKPSEYTTTPTAGRISSMLRSVHPERRRARPRGLRAGFFIVDTTSSRHTALSRAGQGHPAPGRRKLGNSEDVCPAARAPTSRVQEDVCHGLPSSWRL